MKDTPIDKGGKLKFQVDFFRGLRERREEEEEKEKKEKKKI